MEAYNKGDYLASIEWFERALLKVEYIYGKKSCHCADALSHLASIYKKAGNYKKSELKYLEAIEIQKEVLPENYSSDAIHLNNLSSFYSDRGLYKKSEPLNLEVVDIEDDVYQVGDSSYLLTLSNLALLYSRKGLYGKADSLLKDINNLQQKIHETNQLSYTSVLNNLATIHTAQGRFNKAELLLKESLSLHQSNQRVGHPDNITTLNNLGILYSKQNRHDLAEAIHLKAKNLSKKNLGDDHPYYAWSLGLLASVYHHQGRLTKSKDRYIESIKIRLEALGEDHYEYKTSLNDLASAYIAEGAYSKAEPLLLRAKNNAKRNYGNEHITYARSLSNLASLYSIRGEFMKGYHHISKACEIMWRQLRQNFAFLSEKEKMLFLNEVDGVFKHSHNFLAVWGMYNSDIIKSDYKWTLATKGILFNTEKKIKQRITRSNDRDLIRLYNQWLEGKTNLSKLYQKTIKERRLANIDLIAEEERVNEIEKELSLKSKIFASGREEVNFGWKDVQQKLSKGEAAIEIVRLKNFQTDRPDSVVYIGMIVKSDTRDYPELVVLGNGNDLENKHFHYYKNSINLSKPDGLSYYQYWLRIQRKLKGIRKVYFSADGIYHSISLGGLFHNRTKKYLLDEIDIELVNSTKDLVVAKRNRSPKREANLMGFPSYNQEVSTKAERDRSLDVSISRAMASGNINRFLPGRDIQMLPGTKNEVDNLKEILEQAGVSVRTFLLEDATESNVKSWKNPLIAHIATHGYFLKDQEIDTSVPLVQGISSDVLIDNPLLRSGLLLAGAKKAIESGGDGILTAYEAKNLNLDETELVVLSACETGLGKIKNGEGVYGLQRAFRAAGAATVLMSLWSVSDEATQQLMTTFYENWLILKQTKREAFKNAQLSLREKYPQPYFWAAFVMIGE
ncbi:MAG: CHAT domain-containing tetratricopeptide repeat protein [Bacteroidota bacterium]